MTVKEIRQQFLDFFEQKGHKIVPSAPIVNQSDPTLMFINSGMAQFKDYFLGNETPSVPRIADTQKCLRVSGKHNDLEDVGRDSYHQTMFEMLGNWSFGDYFKKEAIAWAWELLTEVYKIDKDRLYVTVFEGDAADGVAADEEAYELWQEWIAKDRILRAGKKDNFWEMGAQGPCGPCSEIHIDIRPEAERQAVDARTLVNEDHPLVIEIWNLVFMQFNRLADGSLVPLANKCIDTGMGLERLAMALQQQTSNYDTDLFSTIIKRIEARSGMAYTNNYAPDAMCDIAMRVVADHLRAVVLVIADGQQPSNTGAGYVVRRVLRRAVRYYYSFLEIKEPFIYELVPLLADIFDGVFPEVKAQTALLQQTIKGEEESFLRTLERGLRLFDELKVKDGVINGEDAFVLFDTYGFPFDLTLLLAQERGHQVDKEGFDAALQRQKNKSKKDAAKELSDWVTLDGEGEVTFVGYDQSAIQSHVLKYRKVVAKKKEQYQIVLAETPFYAESGGQVGDTGTLRFGEEVIPVLDTKKENNLIVHWVKALPEQIDQPVLAQINTEKRHLTERNHSVAHLAHAALRQVLGTHVQQKGSYVSDEKMRFDFSHPSKMTTEELLAVERLVNAKIRANIPLKEERSVPIETAKASGAMMLFGEKYGEAVRIITFEDDFSKELCGGCHVSATGAIGLFRLVQETSVAAGIRRIEALTGEAAMAYTQAEHQALMHIRQAFKHPKDLNKSVDDLLSNHKALQKQLEKMAVLEAQLAKGKLQEQIEPLGPIRFLAVHSSITSKDGLQQLTRELHQAVDDLVIVLGGEHKGKALLTISVDPALLERYDLKAGNIVKAAAQHIQGGGGGRPNYATAGGKNIAGLPQALKAARAYVEAAIS